jgi:hypothetical protein
MKKEDIRLESYLNSQTYRHQLRWPRPRDPQHDATTADYREHHILCARDEPDTYVRTLITELSC